MSSSRWSQSLFRCGLRIFPRSHRQQFGNEMTDMFRDGLKEEGTSRWRRWRYLAKAYRGLVINGLILRAGEDGGA